MKIPEPEWTFLWKAFGNTFGVVGGWLWDKLKALLVVVAFVTVIVTVLFGNLIVFRALHDTDTLTNTQSWVWMGVAYFVEVLIGVLIIVIQEQYIKAKHLANPESVDHPIPGCNCEQCIKLRKKRGERSNW